MGQSWKILNSETVRGQQFKRSIGKDLPQKTNTKEIRSRSDK